MAKSETNTKLLYGGLGVLLVVFVLGILFASSKETTSEYLFPEPAEVVKQYFESWNAKDYPNMYATFSDGFKRIESTANNLQIFREYAQSQPIESVKIERIEEKSNDGMTASVDYGAEFLFNDGSQQIFEGTFTLKYREGDVIRGWKLIHPYGENIDEE